MIKWVTPSLAVCDSDDMPLLGTIGQVDTTASWIRAGGNAYVDSDATAAAILRNLGLSDDEVADRLHFANTGQVSQ
jgi:hypothetical protein